MYIIEDRANGIVINHSSGWTGAVRLAWYDPSERRGDCILGPTPVSLRECTCSGVDLIAGRFTHLSGHEPPVNVITRGVALAVETYLRDKLETCVEQVFIRRGKL